jgi:hypothetical protein
MKVSDVLKTSGGYKSFLSCEVPGLVLNCSIKYATMSSKDIKEQHKAVFKLDGAEVSRKYVGEGKKLHWCYDGDVSNIVPEDKVEEIQAFQTIKGKEVAVEPFQKSETIKIIKTAPQEIKNDFLIERFVEVWSEDQAALYKLAEFLDTNKQVALCSIVMTKGYDTQFLGIIEPRFVQDGKFGIVMYCAKKKIVFNHLLDANAKMVEHTKPVGLEMLEEVLV